MRFQFLAMPGTKFVAKIARNCGHRTQAGTVHVFERPILGQPENLAYHRTVISKERDALGREIERKFLVKGDGWRDGARATPMRQGYLAYGPPASVRVRIEGTRAFLNVKESSPDISREEFEYAIPIQDAEALIRLCPGGVVSKTRYRVRHAEHDWEVDVFDGANAGLIVAEVELDTVDEAVALPPWIGEEVSRDLRYRNTYLAQHPYGTWRA